LEVIPHSCGNLMLGKHLLILLVFIKTSQEWIKFFGMLRFEISSGLLHQFSFLSAVLVLNLDCRIFGSVILCLLIDRNQASFHNLFASAIL